MARSIEIAKTLLAKIDHTNASRPTPCSEWTVSDVARHLIAVLDRAAAGPSGRAVDDMPVLAELPVEALHPASEASARQLHRAWADDATLERSIDVPWGRVTGAQAMSVYAAEVLLHSWDIAVSIGIEPDWPEPDTTAHLQMAQVAFPAQARRVLPFGPIIDADPAATTIDRLAAWMGRDVSTWRGPSQAGRDGE